MSKYCKVASNSNIYCHDPCMLRFNRTLKVTTFARYAHTRPTIAPKPVLDTKHIRLNPGLYEQNCLDRNCGQQSKHPWKIADLFAEWQSHQRAVRNVRERSNAVRHKLANPRSQKSVIDEKYEENLSRENREGLLAEARELSIRLDETDKREKEIQAEIGRLALALPNLTSAKTPRETPEVIGEINPRSEEWKSASDRIWRSHAFIGSELGILDFASAAGTSGWGWYYLLDEAALLEQALIQYAISVGMRRGWKIVSPPSMVYSHIADACGFLPRDQNNEQQTYTLEQAEKNKAKPSHVLAGTSEISLAAMKANTTLEETELPLKTMGVSRCYRAEAGARGTDTKGLYRVHEFTKVEMFAWTKPDERSDELFGSGDSSQSNTLFEEIIDIQREILQSLGLHCRILEMPATDLGASASRKCDVEAYFPSRREKHGGWGEVTSASICTDYQSRRMGTRVKMHRPQRLDWAYTLNGTAMAIPRVIAAILEEGWHEQSKTIVIPSVLQPWMGGVEHIGRKV